MAKYLVNTTFLVYMTNLQEIETFAGQIQSIKEVVQELKYLKQIEQKITEVKIEKAELIPDAELENLSDVDLKLLETAKTRKDVLITDDRKLAKIASRNKVMVLNTPRFICVLTFARIISYEKAQELLYELRSIYVRSHTVKKSIKDLEKWRY